MADASCRTAGLVASTDDNDFALNGPFVLLFGRHFILSLPLPPLPLYFSHRYIRLPPHKAF